MNPPRNPTQDMLDWLDARLLEVVDLELARRLNHRTKRRVTSEQMMAVHRKIAAMNDEEFATWFRDSAEPIEQTMLYGTYLMIRGWLQTSQPGDIVVSAVWLHAASGDSLRTVLATALRLHQGH